MAATASPSAPASVLAPGPAAVPGRRDRNRLRTRRALSLSALNLVAEHGYDNVTIEMIADAAGVSARTFSNYFAGKDDAVLAIVPEPVSSLRTAVGQQPADLPLLAALKAILTSVATELAAHADTVDLQLRVLRAEPRLIPAFRARFAEIEEVNTEWIADRLGVDPRADRRPRLLAGLMDVVMRSALDRRRTAKTLATLPALVDEGFDLLVATVISLSR